MLPFSKIYTYSSKHNVSKQRSLQKTSYILQSLSAVRSGLINSQAISLFHCYNILWFKHSRRNCTSQQNASSSISAAFAITVYGQLQVFPYVQKQWNCRALKYDVLFQGILQRHRNKCRLLFTSYSLFPSVQYARPSFFMVEINIAIRIFNSTSY